MGVAAGIGAVLGLGGLAVGGWYLHVWIDKEPVAYTLDHDKAASALSSITGENNVGKLEDNKKVLVANIAENSSWWTWNYENRIKNVAETDKNNWDEAFKKVNKGYSTASADSTTAINQVCETYYKKSKTEISSDKEKKLASLKLFCTMGGNKEVKEPTQ